MSEVHTCPICSGLGTVPPGFYDPPASGTSITVREQCRACGGRGIIIVRDTVYPPNKLGMTIKWNPPAMDWLTANGTV